MLRRAKSFIHRRKHEEQTTNIDLPESSHLRRAANIDNATIQQQKEKNKIKSKGVSRAKSLLRQHSKSQDNLIFGFIPKPKPTKKNEKSEISRIDAGRQSGRKEKEQTFLQEVRVVKPREVQNTKHPTNLDSQHLIRKPEIPRAEARPESTRKEKEQTFLQELKMKQHNQNTNNPSINSSFDRNKSWPHEGKAQPQQFTRTNPLYRSEGNVLMKQPRPKDDQGIKTANRRNSKQPDDWQPPKTVEELVKSIDQLYEQEDRTIGMETSPNLSSTQVPKTSTSKPPRKFFQTEF